MPKFVAIITHAVESDIRDLLHLAVKQHAEDWWHEFPDVWIVKSNYDPLWWQDRVRILFGISGSLLVIELPEDPAQRGLGYLLRTTSKSSLWFNEVYSEKSAGYNADYDDEPPF